MTDRLDPTLIEEAEFMDRAALAALMGFASQKKRLADDAVDEAVVAATFMLRERRKWRKEMGL